MEWPCPFLYNGPTERGLRPMSLLEVSGLKKTYKTRFGGAAVEALKNV